MCDKMKGALLFLGVVVVVLAVVVYRLHEPSDWRFTSIPSQNDKVVICTGANSGIGFEFSRHMAKNGATVVLACRSPQRCSEAKKRILAEFPQSNVDDMVLDLASLKSIRNFVEKFKSKYKKLDILCNNAGVMALPFNLTEDNFEMHIGINHLGTFAITGLLYPLLSSTPGSRVVTVSSLASLLGSVDPDDLNMANRYYAPFLAYSHSKQANILFMTELDKRITQHGHSVVSVAVHPGYSATELQMKTDHGLIGMQLMKLGNTYFAQSAEMGSAPTLYAATEEHVRGGRYYAPDGVGEMWGWAKEVRVPGFAGDAVLGKKLWEVSEKLTGVKYL